VGLVDTLLQRVHAKRGRSRRPAVLANSVPKAGTHLLLKSLSLFPSLSMSGVHVDMRLDPHALKRTLRTVRSGCVVTAHLGGFKRYVRAVKASGFKTFLIIRDPRDVAVSAVPYILRTTHHHLHEYFRSSLPDDHERLMAVIRGVPQCVDEHRRVGRRDIAEYYRIFMLWFGERVNCVVRFESLVGPRGGGAHALQIVEIERMAAHLGIDLSDGETAQIADAIFDPRVATFRQGCIGDWRNHFTEEHKIAFKQVAGRLLIELGYEEDLNW
jgi:hypothetical protein